MVLPGSARDSCQADVHLIEERSFELSHNYHAQGSQNVFTAPFLEH